MTPSSIGIFDDLSAEQDALDAVLDALPTAAWPAPSTAPGWSISDVVLHLAQTEEAVAASAGGVLADRPWQDRGATVDEAMDAWVAAERAEPAAVLRRWRVARRAAVDALRRADPAAPLGWVTTRLKPRTLATTRLAEHWAHAHDVADAIGVDYPDTPRLRHIAWLGHSTLPYAFRLAGLPAVAVRCDLTGPDGASWAYGPADAPSRITGHAGAFCRVGAQRLAPAESGLETSGPHAATALSLLRNYALT